MAKRDYYDVLGVDRDADASQIKRAYRRLAMSYHPDRNPDAEDAEEKFKEATEAYQVLSDSEKRSAYDQFGHSGVEGIDPSSFFNGGGFRSIFEDFDSMFSSVFSTQRGQRRDERRRGADLQYNLSLDLEQAVAGDTVKITIPVHDDCSDCAGTGVAEGKRPATCSQCNGAGEVQLSRGFLMVRQTCPQCRGEGVVIRDPCLACDGAGRVERRNVIDVKVPPGVDSGNRLRLSGRGDSGTRGGPPGDLFVVVHVKPHDFFVREGPNLLCEVHVSFTQAALGDELTLPTFDGDVQLKVPSGTQSGTQLRVRAGGVAELRSRRRGDLICRVVVETPVKLTAKQKELLQELQASMDQHGDRHGPKASTWAKSFRDFFDRLTHS